jgi:hypothetical protein
VKPKSRVTIQRGGGPPELVGPEALTTYLLMLLQQAINARDQVPEWSAIRIRPDAKIFQDVGRAKDTFWLRYGCAAGAIDIARATRAIDGELYGKLKGKLTELLVSTRVKL